MDLLDIALVGTTNAAADAIVTPAVKYFKENARILLYHHVRACLTRVSTRTLEPNSWPTTTTTTICRDDSTRLRPRRQRQKERRDDLRKVEKKILWVHFADR
jgi:hypothetical protein